MATPEAVGEVAGVGEQPVGDVDHRGGAGLGGDRPGVVRRLGAAVGLDQHARRAEAAAQHRQPAGGPALAPAQREHVARLRRRTGAPAPACRRPSTVTAITTWSARVRSPPTTLAPTSAHSSAKPRAKSSAHCGRQVGGRGQPDRQRVRAPAHGVDVGEVLRRRRGGRRPRRRPSRGGSAAPRPSGRSRPRRARCGRAARPRRRPGRPARAPPARRARASALDQPELADVGERSRQRGTTWRPSHQITPPASSRPASRPVGAA